MIEQQNVSPAPAVEVSADLDGEVAVFGAASELTLGVAGPHSESGVPQKSHV